MITEHMKEEKYIKGRLLITTNKIKDKKLNEASSFLLCHH